MTKDKYIITSDLPHWKNGKSQRINWEASIGYDISFYYYGITGKLRILDVDRYRQKDRNVIMISLEYNGQRKIIRHSCLWDAKIGDLINIKYKSHRIITETGSIVICHCKTYIVSHKMDWMSCIDSEVKYDYRGNVGSFFIVGYSNNRLTILIKNEYKTIDYHNLVKGHIGTLIGIRPEPDQNNYPLICDDPDMIYYVDCLDDPKASDRYTSGVTRTKLSLTCKVCNDTILMTPCAYKKCGHLMCSCFSNESYPERFFSNVLYQLRELGLINAYTPQYNKEYTEWVRTYRYDFYVLDIDNNESIVETHGLQHYEDSLYNGYNVNRQKKTDKKKRMLAKKNGINDYIELDCRYSYSNYIKKSIMSSRLPSLYLFKEEDIDWEMADVKARELRYIPEKYRLPS